MTEQATVSDEAVSYSTYPISLAMAQRLEVATDCDPNRLFHSSSFHVHKESTLQALTNILDNAIHALDQWYFATPPSVRAALSHRTCIRIATSHQNGSQQPSITITDLGIGMTRADLINTLGVGRALQPPLPPSNASPGSPAVVRWSPPSLLKRNHSASRGGGRNSSTGSNSAGSGLRGFRSSWSNPSGSGAIPTQRLSRVSISSRSSTLSGSYVSEEDDSFDGIDDESSAILLPCQTQDIGGFYAALCTLAKGVVVGTKSAYDDYYQFCLGDNPLSPNDGSWKDFVLSRPSPDGSIPTYTSDNQITSSRLAHLCGDSGTSITIFLQDSEKQLADPQVLLPLVTKALETTQYTFAIAGLTDPEEEKVLLEASFQEAEILRQLEQEQETEENLFPTGLERERDLTSSFSMETRAKYIPIRLSLEERKLLRLVEAAMNCCDYTTKVDHTRLKSGKLSPTRRIHQQIKGIMSVFRGLITACDANAGRKLAIEEDSVDYEEFLPLLQQLLEIARRHKVCNPEKMRTEYGQLIYLWQDAIQLQQEGYLEAYFSANNSLQDTPMKTVYSYLKERNGLDLLQDQHIHMATEEVLATDGKTRHRIDAEIRRKEKAVKLLKDRYQSHLLSRDDIHLCLYSICDNNSFLNSNRVPIDKAIAFLTKEFHPKRYHLKYSLSIVQGEDGARLSHSHEKQYYFALQSLTLWRDIIHDMFRLWAMAEVDLLNSSIRYNLHDTGQGMQRVQQSPQTYQAMQEILRKVQQKVQHWVGSSVIHLGDHNVPNALSFIDKYTQVPRILGPIISCLENLERLCDDDYALHDMIEDGFGGFRKVRKEILHDFFRSAFDGSGADNFYDAGSCIDGRLTSAWNWCSQLPNKPFYPLFKLTGFSGFDGEFH